MQPPNPTSESCNQFFGRWRLTTSGVVYVGLCIVITLVIRAVQSLFKAWALKHNDVPTEYQLDPRERSYWTLYRQHFFGFSLGKNSDLWLPTLIGLAELIAYPVLLAVGQTVIIGAWIAFKTAGAWTGWRTSGTAFNRFLLFSLLNVIVAYFLSAHFIRAVPCSVGKP
jgi:hypothetical protein